MKHKNGGCNGTGTAAAPARDTSSLPDKSEVSDVARERRVEELRQQIQGGCYKAAAGELAKKIIDEHLH